MLEQLEMVMGPTGRLWHITLAGQSSPLCGMPPEKVKKDWRRIPYGFDLAGKTCSNCSASKIVSNIKKEYLYPSEINGITHKWYDFTDEVTCNLTTVSKLKSTVESARTLFFGNIKSGIIKKSCPESPNSFPVVETHGRDPHSSVIHKLLINFVGDKIVYYPLLPLIMDEDSEFYNLVLHNSGLILSKVDYWVIVGAVKAAIDAPQYFTAKH